MAKQKTPFSSVQLNYNCQRLFNLEMAPVTGNSIHSNLLLKENFLFTHAFSALRIASEIKNSHYSVQVKCIIG